MLHKTFSIVMALLLLLSTVSWKVEKHYCMGRLISTAWFVDVDDCGMDMALSVKDNQDFETKNSCCDDEVILIEGQDDLKLSFNDLNVDHQSFLVAFAHSYTNLFKNSLGLSIPLEHYPPPILVEDIQLLDQVFLI